MEINTYMSFDNQLLRFFQVYTFQVCHVTLELSMHSYALVLHSEEFYAFIHWDRSVLGWVSLQVTCLL